MKHVRLYFSFLAVVSSLFLGCTTEEVKFESTDFYYWKTVYAFNSSEREFIEHCPVDRLLVRLFDIEMNLNADKPSPVGIISFRDSLYLDKLIPVVYIKNQVFISIDEVEVDTLALKTSKLIASILSSIDQTGKKEIQIDCDWTASTKEDYFHYLEKLQEYIPESIIVSTVRLHQIKFTQEMGVPPGDRAVLMYYNMGKIACDSSNSILNNTIGEQYLGNLNEYPLRLSWALPVFSWGIHCVNEQPNHLMNKADLGDFISNPLFVKLAERSFQVKSNGFFQGHYLYEGDVVKFEEPAIADLNLALKLLQKYSDEQSHSIVFFDLDSTNISKYESFISRCSKP